MAAVNRLADPANLFSSGRYEQAMAEALAAGSNVGDAGNFDFRLLRMATIRLTRSPSDVVVIGFTFVCSRYIFRKRTTASQFEEPAHE